MAKTAVYSVIILFVLAIVLVLRLPGTATPNGHTWESWHPEVLFLTHPDSEFACKYNNGAQSLWLQCDPEQPGCPPKFGGAFLTLGGLLITAFMGTALYWLNAIKRGGYEKEE